MALKRTGTHGILDRATGPPKELVLIYISPNYFACRVEPSKTPCRALSFCESSRAKSSFSVGILNTIGKVTSRIAKVTCFTVKVAVPAGPPPKVTTLSRIRPSRALGPVIWAIRPPAARQITVLSERPWLLSRARGGVRLRNARQYRGIDVTDGGRDGNLRHIRRCRFSNSQHYRRNDALCPQNDVFHRQYISEFSTLSGK